MNKFDITESEAEKIFDEMIIPQIIRDMTPNEIPEAYILGGQPGSGKSAFAREILKSNNDIVFINGDDLRAYHPKYYFYLKENDKEAADLTQSVCNFWIESLVKKCIAKKLDFIIEGTMRKKEVPMKTALMLREAGFLVNLVVISTPYELSLSSIEQRYSELKRLGQPARYTKKESHDEAYNNIEETLSDLLKSNLFSKFLIYQRNPGGFTENIFTKEDKDKILNNFREGRQRKVENEEKSNPFVKEGSFKTSVK